jgi:hypothetical protein
MAESPKNKSVATTKSHLPADFNLADQIKRDLEAVASQVETGTFEKIRMSGRGFTTPDGETGETLMCVIVDFASANNYYADAFDADKPAPPTCFAVNKNPSLMVPDPASSDVQAESCTKCPKNQFESGVGKSKACKNTRLLAVMQEGAVEEGAIWLLSVPPSSIKYFDAYVSTTLKSRNNITPICALTEIYMDKANDFASPRFRLNRILKDEEINNYYQRRAEAESILVRKPSSS